MDKTKLPVHVSLIMDGNGRWAQQQGKNRVYGHFEGVESVRAVMSASVDMGIKYVSFFAFSEENWNRPDSEVNTLMELMGEAMSAEMPTFQKYNVRFLVLGNREHLSEKLKAKIDATIAATAGNTGLTMIVFLSYSGRWDILQAFWKVRADRAADCAMEMKPVAFHNSAAEYYELHVRTPGRKRVSSDKSGDCRRKTV